MSDFSLSFKSTIDKVGYDLAVANSLPIVDLDDLVNAEEVFHQGTDCLVWEFAQLNDSPRDPLYSFLFRIGARTINDSANYEILKLMDDVKAEFPVQSRIEIRDYSGASAGPVVGSMFITDVRVDPQQYDKQYGIRMVVVAGRAVRDD